MKLTKDLKEIIRRKLDQAKLRKEKNIKEKILTSLEPFCKKVTELEKQIRETREKAENVAKKMGASSISLYSSKESYVYLDKENDFDTDEEYFKILEEIEVSNDPCLEEIFKRIDRM